MPAVDPIRRAPPRRLSSYELVERCFETQLALAVRLRLDLILRHLSLSALLGLTRRMVALLVLVFPALERDLVDTFARCFPGMPGPEQKRRARQHLVYVFFQVWVIASLPYLTAEQFEAMFDYRELEERVPALRARRFVLVGSHFFSFLELALLAEILHRRGVRLAGTFQYKENPRIATFTRRLKARFHWDDHVPLNLEGTSSMRVLREITRVLAAGCESVFLFADVRFRPVASDVAYRAGSATLYANRGLAFCVEQLAGIEGVIPAHLTFEGCRFHLHMGEVLPPDGAASVFYERILPEQLQTMKEQWQLWFMARDVLMQPAPGPAQGGRSAAHARVVRGQRRHDPPGAWRTN